MCARAHACALACVRLCARVRAYCSRSASTHRACARAHMHIFPAPLKKICIYFIRCAIVWGGGGDVVEVAVADTITCARLYMRKHACMHVALTRAFWVHLQNANHQSILSGHTQKNPSHQCKCVSNRVRNLTCMGTAAACWISASTVTMLAIARISYQELE